MSPSSHPGCLAPVLNISTAIEYHNRPEKASVLLAVFTLGMIDNVMNLKNVPAYSQQVIKGLIIIFAVLLQGIQRRSETTKTS